MADPRAVSDRTEIRSSSRVRHRPDGRPRWLAMTHKNPFSRRAFAPELCHAIPKQALPSPSQKKGGGAPTGAPSWAASKPMRRAPCSPSSPACGGGSRRGRARLSAPHRGIRRGFTLGSARAALPGTTGCKREDPLRHQCSEHLAVRHVPDGSMPKPPARVVTNRARGNRTRSVSRIVSRNALHERDSPYVTEAVTDVKGRLLSK